MEWLYVLVSLGLLAGLFRIASALRELGAHIAPQQPVVSSPVPTVREELEIDGVTGPETQGSAETDSRTQGEGREAPAGLPTRYWFCPPALINMPVPESSGSWSLWLRENLRDLLVRRVRSGTLDGDLAKRAAKWFLEQETDVNSEGDATDVARVFSILGEMTDRFGIDLELSELRNRIYTEGARMCRAEIAKAIDGRDIRSVRKHLKRFQQLATTPLLPLWRISAEE